MALRRSGVRIPLPRSTKSAGATPAEAAELANRASGIAGGTRDSYRDLGRIAGEFPIPMSTRAGILLLRWHPHGRSRRPRRPRRGASVCGCFGGASQAEGGGFRNFVVTNQSGIGRGLIGEAQYRAVQAELISQIGEDLVDGSLFLSGRARDGLHVRKPAPGMLFEGAAEFDLILANLNSVARWPTTWRHQGRLRGLAEGEPAPVPAGNGGLLFQLRLRPARGRAVRRGGPALFGPARRARAETARTVRLDVRAGADQASRLVQGHGFDGELLPFVPTGDVIVGSGGLYSTPRDLLRWLAWHLDRLARATASTSGSSTTRPICAATG